MCHLSFCDWLVSLTIMSSGPTHVLTNDKVSFLLRWVVSHCERLPQFHHLFTRRWSRREFSCLGYCDNAVMNTVCRRLFNVLISNQRPHFSLSSCSLCQLLKAGNQQLSITSPSEIVLCQRALPPAHLASFLEQPHPTSGAGKGMTAQTLGSVPGNSEGPCQPQRPKWVTVTFISTLPSPT